MGKLIDFNLWKIKHTRINMPWTVDFHKNINVIYKRHKSYEKCSNPNIIENDNGTLIGIEKYGPRLKKTLSDDTRIIVETNKKDPKPIAIITAGHASNAKGFRIRITPKYGN